MSKQSDNTISLLCTATVLDVPAALPIHASKKAGTLEGVTNVLPANSAVVEAVPFCNYSFHAGCQDLSAGDYFHLQQKLTGLIERVGTARCEYCAGSVEQIAGSRTQPVALSGEVGVLLVVEVLPLDSVRGLSAGELFDFFDVAGFMVDGVSYRQRHAAELSAALAAGVESLALQQQSFSLPLSAEQEILLADLLQTAGADTTVWHVPTGERRGKKVFDAAARYQCQSCLRTYAAMPGTPAIRIADRLYSAPELLALPQRESLRLLATIELQFHSEIRFCRQVLEALATFELSDLPLDRRLRTLSASESVRIQLVRLALSGFQLNALCVPEVLLLPQRSAQSIRHGLEALAMRLGASLHTWLPELADESDPVVDVPTPAAFAARSEQILSLLPAKIRRNQYGHQSISLSSAEIPAPSIEVPVGATVHVSGGGSSGKSQLLQAIAAATKPGAAGRAWKRFEIFAPRFSQRSSTLGEASSLNSLAARCYAQTSEARAAGLSEKKILQMLSGSTATTDAAVQVGGVTLEQFSSTPLADLFDSFWQFEGAGDVLGLLLAVEGDQLTPCTPLSDLPPEYAGIADLLALIMHYSHLSKRPTRTLVGTGFAVDGTLDRLAAAPRALFLNYFGSLAERGMTVFVASARSVFAADCDSVVRVRNAPGAAGEPNITFSWQKNTKCPSRA